MDSNEKVYGILAYFGLLFLVPLLAGKTEFSKFHANQGITLFIFDAILGVIGGAIGWIPIIGWIILGVTGLLGVGLFVLAIIGIVNAANGKMEPVPVVGNLFHIVK